MISAPTGVSAFDDLYVRRPRRGLVLVLLGYLIVGALFAMTTPAWQAPDEPAHYNYIAYIGANAELPVLQMGAYNQEYLNLLLDTRFAHKLSIAPLQYENYQPPLYYLLATPIYWAFGGNLIALRLFGVLLGVVTLILIYRSLELVFPGKSLIPLGASAFAALLPMHVAMLASVNNDTAAGLLLVASIYVLLRWLRAQFYASASPGKENRVRYPTTLILLGVLLGLGMITKIYAYVITPIALAVIIGVLWMRPQVQYQAQSRIDQLNQTVRPLRNWRMAIPALRTAAWAAVPALAIPLPMWLRNLYLYGRWDFLGLTWHDEVVVGQLRTSQFIEMQGWVAYSERAFSFTFKSFWGVFGWMGVFMDERIYTALLIFSGVIFLGILWATVRFISGGSDADMDFFQLFVLCLLGLVLTVVTLSYIWYNLKYVQHQGRYFLWGLLPIGVIVALGWREVLQPLQGVITGMLAAVLAVSMVSAGYFTGGVDKWALLTIGALALLLLAQPFLLTNSKRYALRWLPSRFTRWLEHPALVSLFGWLRTLAWAMPFLLLFLLDLMIPSIFIIPQLAR